MSVGLEWKLIPLDGIQGRGGEVSQTHSGQSAVPSARSLFLSFLQLNLFHNWRLMGLFCGGGGSAVLECKEGDPTSSSQSLLFPNLPHE